MVKNQAKSETQLIKASIMKKIIFTFATLLLAACGGAAQPITNLPTLCYSPVDVVTPSAGCVGQLQGNSLTNAMDSLRSQLTLSGPLILWTGRKQDFQANQQSFQFLIQAASKFVGKFPYVLLEDEPGWCGLGACPWIEESEILSNATIVHAAGMKTIINIQPDVILDDRFVMQNINAFDAISIDVYPSARPGPAVSPYLTLQPNFRGCRWSANQYANLFYCATQRLRSNGFVGDVVLAYQGFGVRGIPRETLVAQLTEQRESVMQAQAMGASAVMAWGKYLGAAELAEDGNLFQLAGTEFEYLIQ